MQKNCGKWDFIHFLEKIREERFPLLRNSIVKKLQNFWPNAGFASGQVCIAHLLPTVARELWRLEQSASATAESPVRDRPESCFLHWKNFKKRKGKTVIFLAGNCKFFVFSYCYKSPYPL